mmetsp:Transcript_3691/g.7462  ORF Transcript_3691/g.7462 Transcript_3691/m.7462 type:complete len:93 (+) Transcript_3691:165-443(+)
MVFLFAGFAFTHSVVSRAITAGNHEKTSLFLPPEIQYTKLNKPGRSQENVEQYRKHPQLLIPNHIISFCLYCPHPRRVATCTSSNSPEHTTL